MKLLSTERRIRMKDEEASEQRAARKAREGGREGHSTATPPAKVR